MKPHQRLSLLWKRHAPLEEQLFAAVRTVLPEPARFIYDAQVAAISSLRRLPQWNEIDLYMKDKGRGLPLFTRKDEISIAEVRFSARGQMYKATLGCSAGRIFDFEIHPSPKSIAFAHWDAAPTVMLLDDPLRLSADSKVAKIIMPLWMSYLQAYKEDCPPNWTLYDEHSAYRVVFEQGEFLVLAENDDDQRILQRIDPASDELYYLESHDGIPEPLDERLASVIRSK